MSKVQAVNRKRRNKRTYDDKFRASSVLMLSAQGYPDAPGALAYVAKHLDVPASTLKGWFQGTSNPPPANIREEKKSDFKTLFTDEIYSILGVLPDKRDEATYQQLVTSMGIFFDKIRLLDGLPTEVISITADLDALAKRKGLNTADAIRALKDQMSALPDVSMITEGSSAN